MINKIEKIKLPVFILCGGKGTRLDHEGTHKAKPMVLIGKEPILMHIVEYFYKYGFKEFIFCLGFNAKSIVDFFLKKNKKYVEIISNNKTVIKFIYKSKKINFLGNLVFSGIETGTGGRILKSYKALRLKKDFLMTYGDGLSNVNLDKLIKFHYKNRSYVTMTAVKPKLRYGVIKIHNKKVNSFDNNMKKSDTYINGGFFVINKDCIKKIKDKSIYWEKEPLSYFLKIKKLFAYKHDGFWKSLDTLKDKNDFEELLKKKKTPWKI